MMIDEKLPDPQRIRTGKAEITARDELIPTVVVGFAEHGLEGFRMTVNVGDAEEAHDRFAGFRVQPLREDC
jgi:hypothetical protein